ncbi:hypothetical protein [Dyadobacter alkalitolerans]|uniref:hypothetical protein n=1 Tax=Dyadobacter alkalitolerans TaxID=492736 RepID=UPI00047D8F86|nr:hypothetical protein [Dyadobacter alkalitolerans]
MKSNRLGLAILSLAMLVGACKEKNVFEDSPYITVISPVRDQVFQDKDSIRIKAQIEPKNTSVINSRVNIIDKKGKVLFSSNLGCACSNMPLIKIEKSILYPVKKKQDVYLEICADLENGQSICEKIPFVITK